MKRTRFALLAAAGGLAGATILVPVTAGTASAYSSTGTIAAPAPAGINPTDSAFQNTACATPPAAQGAGGWVFTLPSAAAAGDTVSLRGWDSSGLYDLGAYVYKSNCTGRRVVTSTTGRDITITLLAGEQHISVFTTNGRDVAVRLDAPGVSNAPNDPLFAQSSTQDLITSGQWGLRKIKAPDAWAEATGDGIKVAVIDTGLDLTHPDFNCTGKVSVPSGTTPTDTDGHGTHVAGIIGACTNNNIGVAGVAPDSTLVPFKVLFPGATVATIENAIRAATTGGAHVINMSLSVGIAPGGLISVPGSGSALGWLGGLPGLRDAIDDAVAAGVVVVASAGNDSFPLCSYPALEWNVVCVGASDPRDLNSWYGSFPVKDDDTLNVGPGLLAPGGTGQVFCDLSSQEIISTYARSADTAAGDCDGLYGYASIQGTSMAAPHVAGVAALVYEDLGGTRSLANADKVVEALVESAYDLYTPGYDPQSGYGRVDAAAAVAYWP